MIRGLLPGEESWDDTQPGPDAPLPDRVDAAHDAQRRLAAIEVEGYSPRQRAGVHLGRPRKVRKDYLGVDVNIAARVGDAAKQGEVLVSEPVRERLEPGRFEYGRRRKLKAHGAPEQLVVCSVKPTG